MEKIKELMEILFGIISRLFPVILCALVVYIVYLKVTSNRTKDTQKDIVTFINNVNSSYNRTTYFYFNTDFISYSEYFPLDLKIKKTDHGNEIISRFGGKMTINESPKNLAERKEYLQLLHDRKAYEKLYSGLGAYIILFSELKTQECISMARADWKKIAPNFMGLEASFVNKKHPYNGVENLNYFILEDNEDEVYQSRDEGKISRTPLTYLEAWEACRCFGANCTVALKFK